MTTTEAKQLPDFIKPLINKIAKEEHFIEFSVISATGSNVGDNFVAEMYRISIIGKRNGEKAKLN